MTISRNAQISLLIAGSSLMGAANTLKRLDKNNTGSDDIAGSICTVVSPVLLALAFEELNDLKSALRTSIDAQQALLDSLEEDEGDSKQG